MNKVRVTICGKKYSLNTDNQPENISALAKKLDKDINSMVRSYPSLGIQSAAVICALSAYEEKLLSEGDNDNLRLQIKQYLDEAAKARDERDLAVIEADRLREKLAEQDSAPLHSDPEFDAEQLVFENTITPAVTIPVEEPEMHDVGKPPAPSRANKRKKKR